MKSAGDGESYNLIDKRLDTVERHSCLSAVFNLNRKRRYLTLLKKANAAQLAYEEADDKLNVYLETISRLHNKSSVRRYRSAYKLKEGKGLARNHKSG